MDGTTILAFTFVNFAIRLEPIRGGALLALAGSLVLCRRATN